MAKIPSFILRPVFELVSRWPWLGKVVNRLAINATVNSCRNRPHPWSTVHSYVSWRSLSDKSFSARHLRAWHHTYAKTPAEVVQVFARRDDRQELSDKSTCLFPAFAQYLTDGFIRTRPQMGEDGPEVRKQNTSNHEIDLCPLYGRTVIQTNVLRLKSSDPSQFGRLKTQTLSDGDYPPFLFDDEGKVKLEFAVLDAPLGLDDDTPSEIRQRIFALGGDRANGAPQVSMMNTLFLREHNRLAGEMARAYPEWDDDRVFETARSTNIVQFIKIVVEEYINHISPAPFRFLADPEVAWKAPWNRPNWITTEFSLLYRWHSLVPDVIRWGENTHPLGDTIMNNAVFLETGLARSFQSMSEQPAAKLGARNTALPLVGIEEKAIIQSRLCEIAPYAEYRAYMGMSRPTAFTDISSRTDVVEMLKSIYKDVNEVEFYVGLFAEDPIPNSPLPPLLESMVAVDAFSQALTNPLLSQHVWKEETFSKIGWDCIHSTTSLRDVLDRNVPGGIGDMKVTMTQPTWRHRW